MRDREWAQKFVDNLQAEDRITVYTQVNPETGERQDNYVLHRPSIGPQPIFMSGDCAAVKEAIDSGWLETTGDATYRKRTLEEGAGRSRK